MKTYEVTIPIAGHAYRTVNAESEEEAIEKALDEASLTDVESWETLRQFNQGNICYCPKPWEAEAHLAFGEDEEDE